MAPPIQEIPPQDHLLKLAQAALSNAGDLLADARLLFDAGRFARAHALATLACEELGKEQECLRAIWLPPAPRLFWDTFNNHTRKLGHAQALAVADSGEPIHSPHGFNQRVNQRSHSAHQRKLRGLYVGYADGEPQLPGEITEHETRQLIERTQTLVNLASTGWVDRANHVQRLSQQTETFRRFWGMFLIWVAESETDRLITVLRDGGSSTEVTDLLCRFLQHLGISAGDWLPRVLAENRA
jgi:AbiV family abortive infection protein